MESLYALTVAVLVPSVVVLAVYAVIVHGEATAARRMAAVWRDAYANEAKRHSDAREALHTLQMSRYSHDVARMVRQ